MYINRDKFKKQNEQDGVSFLSLVEAQVRVDAGQSITLISFDSDSPNELHVFFATNEIYGNPVLDTKSPRRLQRSTWKLPYHYSDDDSEINIKTAAGLIEHLARTGVTINFIANEAALLDTLDTMIHGNMVQHDLSELNFKRPPMAQVVDHNADQVLAILTNMDPAAARLCAAMWEQDRMSHRARIDAIYKLTKDNELFWKEYRSFIGVVIRDKDNAWQVTRREHSQFLGERDMDTSSIQFVQRYFGGNHDSMTTIMLDIDARVDSPGYRLTLSSGNNDVREMIVGSVMRMSVMITDPIFHRNDVTTDIIFALSRENTEYLITHLYRQFAKHYHKQPA